jgi:hypothetical protein
VFYDDEFVLSLPEDAEQAILIVLNKILDAETQTRTIPDVLEARDLLLVLTEQRLIGSEMNVYHDALQTDNPEKIFDAIMMFRSKLLQKKTEETTAKRKNRFVVLLGMSFGYSLSEADLTRIQILVNELRDLITANERFEEDHKRRVLERLETLQRELHRRISNLDRFYGLIGDAGVLLGKFGHDAKPFVDRIGEIVQIVWRSQANAEQLPASAKPALLTSEPKPEDE